MLLPGAAFWQELAPSPSTPYPAEGDQEPGSRGALAVQRWQWAIKSVINSKAMVRNVDLLNDRLAPAGDRLHALVDLEVRLAGYPQRKQLMLALLKRREHKFSSFQDHVTNELFITGRSATAGQFLVSALACMQSVAGAALALPHPAAPAPATSPAIYTHVSPTAAPAACRREDL